MKDPNKRFDRMWKYLKPKLAKKIKYADEDDYFKSLLYRFYMAGVSDKNLDKQIEEEIE